ncbi:MAG: prepilin-type N-terminal cleavage/methylation domain-containing protein [Gemmatimonadetes bacterium]|nr:prepilin-type N-terminal cleavage/methylation domain-containing protein [Gemmatimonadota bacterium]
MRNTKGFTLIELLIVVVIIGILAAIAIPRFASTKEKAFDAAAKSDLRNAMTSQEVYFAENQTYADDPANLDLASSQGVTLDVDSGDATGYTMSAQHGSSSNDWCVDSSVGSIAACAAP